MKRLTRLTLALLTTIFAINLGLSQCATWIDSPQKNDAENAHSIYRQAMKSDDFEIAFPNWEKAYAIAPAADGKRDYHFTDGAKLLAQKFKDDGNKEYIDRAIALIEDAEKCLADGTITVKGYEGETGVKERIGYNYGRLAYDLFYTFNAPYSKTLSALKKSVEMGGNDTEYIVFDPYASIVVYNFEKEQMDAATAREAHETLNAIADYNIENNAQFSDYYEQAKASMNAKFSKIERSIFDCEYFKTKLRPDYDADPENPEVIKRVLAILKGQGCDASDPLYAELDTKWKKYASAENAKIQAEFEANNPGVAAKKLYDQGDYQGAVSKYQEAINAESNPEKKASYLFSLASIQFRKLKSYSAARKSALEAASLKPGWGRPYMLIGDMYGSSARNCGDSWNQRLAIIAAIDKYRYAKSVDSSQAEDANSRISKYSRSLPTQEEGFMRKVKTGQTVTVGCWIGESVKVQFAN